MNQVTESVVKATSPEVDSEVSPELNAQQENKNQMAQIIAQTEKVNKQLTYFHKHKLFKVYNSIPQLLWFNLLKGVAFGLGSVLGATVVLSALIYLLSQIEFVPFIGEWVSEILEIVKTEVPN
jgi:hypothetical protein